MRFLYLSNPRLGSWLEDLQGVTELRGLKLLRLAGVCGWLLLDGSILVRLSQAHRLTPTFCCLLSLPVPARTSTNRRGHTHTSLL